MTAETAVGLGQIAVSSDRDQALVCYGIGSCVVAVLYDPVARVGGMAHVVLPESRLGQGSGSPGKYADTAVVALLAAMTDAGVRRQRLIARMTGGAQVLAGFATASGFDVGQRNVVAVQAAFSALGIPITGSDTGGSRGRTVRLLIDTGQVLVNSIGAEAREL